MSKAERLANLRNILDGATMSKHQKINMLYFMLNQLKKDKEHEEEQKHTKQTQKKHKNAKERTLNIRYQKVKQNLSRQLRAQVREKRQAYRENKRNCTCKSYQEINFEFQGEFVFKLGENLDVCEGLLSMSIK
jgi:hypothetical protein